MKFTVMASAHNGFGPFTCAAGRRARSIQAIVASVSWISPVMIDPARSCGVRSFQVRFAGRPAFLPGAPSCGSASDMSAPFGGVPVSACCR